MWLQPATTLGSFCYCLFRLFLSFLLLIVNAYHWLLPLVLFSHKCSWCCIFQRRYEVDPIRAVNKIEIISVNQNNKVYVVEMYHSSYTELLQLINSKLCCVVSAFCHKAVFLFYWVESNSTTVVFLKWFVLFVCHRLFYSLFFFILYFEFFLILMYSFCLDCYLDWFLWFSGSPRGNLFYSIPLIRLFRHIYARLSAWNRCIIFKKSPGVTDSWV